MPSGSSRFRSIAVCLGFGLFPLAMAMEYSLEKYGLTVVKHTPKANGGYSEWPPMWSWYSLLSLSFLLMLLTLIHVIWRRSRTAACVVGLVMIGALSYVFITRPCGCAAPEPDAVAQLRAINRAEVSYLSSSQRRYGTIPELITQGLLDARVKDSVSGYIFAVSASGEEYTATAMPASKNIAGYAYYSTADGVIRYATSMRDTCEPCFPPGLSGSPVQ